MKRIIFKSIKATDDEQFTLDENIYQNICGIIGDITDTSLILKFNGSESFTDGHTINVPVVMPFSAPNISDDKAHYTFLEHELSHILFETDIRNYEIFDKWFDKYVGKYLDEYFLKNNFDATQIEIFLEDFKKFDWSTLTKSIFDRVECHRVEHNWGEVYAGSRIRFKYLQKGLGETQSEEEIKDNISDQHITNTLLISRIHKENILRKTATPDILNHHENVAFCVERLGNVENKSAIATLIECRLIVKKWMPRIFIDMLELMRNDISDSNHYIDKFNQRINRLCVSVAGKPSTTPMPAMSGDEKPVDGKPSVSSNHPPGIENPIQNDSVADGCKTRKVSKIQEDAFEEDSEEGEEMLKIAGQKTQQMIHAKIISVIDPETFYDGTKTSSSKVIGKIMEVDVFDSKITDERRRMRNIDQEDVNKLKRFFASVRLKNKLYLDEEGDSIDADAYIQFKANSNLNEIFNNEDIEQGLDVSLVIDLSGSMDDGFKLDLACKYTKTLYKALESLPNVELKAWVFSGKDSDITPVVEIDYSRLSNIVATDKAPFTHTWNGIAHVANKMRGSSGKKLMIVLSDGMPYAGGAMHHVNAIKATRAAVDYSFRTGTKVYGIQIEQSDSTKKSQKQTEEYMCQMFGPKQNWVIVADMDDVKQHLINEVIRGVYRTLVA